MDGLWEIKEEKVKPLLKQIEEASKPTGEYNDRLPRYQNVITYGLKPDATPQDWHAAINWLWYMTRGLENRHKQNRENIELSHQAYMKLLKENGDLKEEVRRLWESLTEKSNKLQNMEGWLVKNAGYDPSENYCEPETY